jgi:hypothetical protein
MKGKVVADFIVDHVVDVDGSVSLVHLKSWGLYFDGLVIFATFILVLLYRYDGVTTSLWIRYPVILLGEGYNSYMYACRLFCG